MVTTHVSTARTSPGVRSRPTMIARPIICFRDIPERQASLINDLNKHPLCIESTCVQLYSSVECGLV